MTAADAALVLAMDGPCGRVVHETAPQRSEFPLFDLPLHRRSLPALKSPFTDEYVSYVGLDVRCHWQVSGQVSGQFFVAQIYLKTQALADW
jgi:hypothetical protein